MNINFSFHVLCSLKHGLKLSCIIKNPELKFINYNKMLYIYIYIYSKVWNEIKQYKKKRCAWCNDYHRRNWTQQHEFKSWTDCISHGTNTLGKGMNPIILPPAMGK